MFAGAGPWSPVHQKVCQHSDLFTSQRMLPIVVYRVFLHICYCGLGTYVEFSIIITH